MSAKYKEWHCDLPATMDAVEQLCRDFHRWRNSACAGLNSFAAELLLREALTNCVLHAGLPEERKRIYCSMRAKADRLIIAIRDEGRGFDWRSVWNRRAGTDAISGRGIEILRRYASLVRFNRAGNSITIVKKFEATA